MTGTLWPLTRCGTVTTGRVAGGRMMGTLLQEFIRAPAGVIAAHSYDPGDGFTIQVRFAPFAEAARSATVHALPIEAGRSIVAVTGVKLST